MFIFALGALAFGGFTGWTLYTAFRDQRPEGFKAWLTDVAIGGGSLCVVVTAIKALL